jgi:hypothetical protein
MNLQRTPKYSRRVSVVAAIFFLLFVDLNGAAADGPTGTSQQPLVDGMVINNAVSEELGLLTLSNSTGTCSASLLSEYWAITAKHCAVGNAPSAISLQAAWGANETQIVAQIHYLAESDVDIALLQVAHPFARSSQYGYVALDDIKPEDLMGRTIEAFGRGINTLATGSGAAATPVQLDGSYRTSLFDVFRWDPNQFGYHSRPGTTTQIAPGDSGGPSYISHWDDPNSARRKAVRTLIGVHSFGHFNCLADKPCVPQTQQWISQVIDANDAAVYLVRDEIRTTAQTFPSTGTGTDSFGVSALANDIYAENNSAIVQMYRHRDGGIDGPGQTATFSWDTPPSLVANWSAFATVIPAGGNRFYGLTPTGDLMWLSHDGWQTGRDQWTRLKVGSAWNGFQRVFGGSDGVVYAVTSSSLGSCVLNRTCRPAGTLLWYKQSGYATGDASTWSEPKIVGTGWDTFTKVFSAGKGVIYGIKPNGDLIYYQHLGYSDGTNRWLGPVRVGNGWQGFSQVFGAGHGVIYALKSDGTLMWYRHNSWNTNNPGFDWSGPVQVGTGWNFKLVVAPLPDDAQPAGLH